MTWAVLMLRTYVEGHRFTIRTDQDALRCILNMEDATGKPARWRLRLKELEFDVVNRAGIKNQAADVLYGLETEEEDTADLKDEFYVILFVKLNTSTVTLLLPVHLENIGPYTHTARLTGSNDSKYRLSKTTNYEEVSRGAIQGPLLYSAIQRN